MNTTRTSAKALYTWNAPQNVKKIKHRPSNFGWRLVCGRATARRRAHGMRELGARPSHRDLAGATCADAPDQSARTCLPRGLAHQTHNGSAPVGFPRTRGFQRKFSKGGGSLSIRCKSISRKENNQKKIAISSSSIFNRSAPFSDKVMSLLK